MTNQITASVEFYFKGEKYSAAIEIDLDQQMAGAGRLPDLHSLLAQSINLGIHSYEYEMLQAETVLFGNALGLATECLNEGQFDFESFKIVWSNNVTLEKIQEIAEEHLSIKDLDQQPGIKNALLEAFNLGAELK